MANKLFSVENIKNFNFGVLILVIAMLVMTIFPLPPFLLDLLFTFNISLSLIILMVCIYVVKPLEFSIFPTILLVTTLLRLTLNIASTRVILLHGHQGAAAAGQVIRAFGEVVIGGNFLVGMIIFTILMIINFVVVTKGAGRISEVSARFTLDAMPGKQMAIDSDLNAGVITQEEAKKRRMEVMEEADFYGSMDGASKFVRGDAIAGLLILLINLIGGIIIGVFQNHMAFSTAVQNFSLLTIGDGLVAQIPSLLMSISAAIIVTRVTNEQDISKQTIAQIFSDSKPIAITAAILLLFALVPSMPHFPFLLLAGILFLIAFRIRQSLLDAADEGKAPAVTEETQTSEQKAELDWTDVVSMDRISLEIGYGLISLVGVNKDGILLTRIKNIRKKLSMELGFLIPSIHVTDNLNMPSSRYKIRMKNVVIAEMDAFPEKVLAINPGYIQHPLNGVSCKDPSFGLDACWIAPSERDFATGLGYTVVDCSTVIATHLNHVIKTNASHLLGYDEVQQILNRLAQTMPKLVETLNSGVQAVPINVIVSVLQKCLAADIPLIDMRTIVEKMIDGWSKSKDVDTLYESVRVSLKHLIIYNISQNEKKIPVAVLEDDLAQILHKSIQPSQEVGEKVMMLEPGLTERIYTRILEYVRRCEVEAIPAVLLITRDLRPLFEKMFKASIPGMHFLSTEEIPEDRQITLIAKIG
jgi:flagellar biosynthesis protein FlhA